VGHLRLGIAGLMDRRIAGFSDCGIEEDPTNPTIRHSQNPLNPSILQSCNALSPEFDNSKIGIVLSDFGTPPNVFNNLVALFLKESEPCLLLLAFCSFLLFASALSAAARGESLFVSQKQSH
jgi:hypothetical protein